ncbi:hypothetical protein Tco_0401261 [Tanacetum coccineum]
MFDLNYAFMVFAVFSICYWSSRSVVGLSLLLFSLFVRAQLAVKRWLGSVVRFWVTCFAAIDCKVDIEQSGYQFEYHRTAVTGNGLSSHSMVGWLVFLFAVAVVRFWVACFAARYNSFFAEIMAFRIRMDFLVWVENETGISEVLITLPFMALVMVLGRIGSSCIYLDIVHTGPRV